MLRHPTHRPRHRAARRPLGGRVPTLLVVALLAATVATVTPVLSSPPATAQEAPNGTTSSDWAPFVGEYRMWCTASTGDPGPCNAHHRGWAIDIDTPLNDPIYAAGSGVVGWIDGGCPPEGMDNGCNARAGNYVAVDHGDHYSRYMHLAGFAEGVEQGATIVAGQLIGYSGASGTNSGGSHLHYDEIGYPLSTSQRIFFGPMMACHGDTAVQYPDVLGTTDWQQVPFGTVLRNDNYACLGGATPEPPPAPPTPTATQPGGAVGLAFGDFNGDGNEDLAIGAPGEDIGKRTDAGIAAVVYGGSRGLTSATEALRQKRGLKGSAERGDLLGAALAAGDFDCDGRDDLAIGIPREDIAGFDDAGAVAVTYGGRNDVDNRDVIIRQGKWIAGPLEAGDLTGASLAAGDFNGDGCDDLAIGAPGEDVDGFTDAGAVMVIYGGKGGFSASSASSDSLYQNGGLAGFTEAGDNVGATLAAGDFNCDGHDDLAIGAPSESIDGASRAGAVNVIYGSPDGVGANPVTLYQSSGIAGILESGDLVGAALATGDFNADGCDDLAVGAPGEDLTGGTDAGAVSVSFGSRDGLRSGSVHFQETGGLAGRVENGDFLGAAIAAVDLDCDGFDDLAVGAPGEDIGGKRDTGWVGVVRGSRRGMAGPLAAFYQGRAGGLPGKNEPGDLVGTALAAGAVNDDSCGDLAIGAPGEAIGSRTEAGRVIVVLGSSGRFTSVSSHSQNRNLPGGAEAGDLLGGPGVWGLLGLSLQ